MCYHVTRFTQGLSLSHWGGKKRDPGNEVDVLGSSRHALLSWGGVREHWEQIEVKKCMLGRSSSKWRHQCMLSRFVFLFCEFVMRVLVLLYCHQLNGIYFLLNR